MKSFILVIVLGLFFFLPQILHASQDDSYSHKADSGYFKSAQPVWPSGREKEMNLFVGFRAIFNKPDASETHLLIAGSSNYRVFLNGRFLAHGPARGPHGFYRVDHLLLPSGQLQDSNLIAIEVAGYNVNSFYLLDQPAFLQAEIVADDKIIASTNGHGNEFQASVLNYRTQKVQRYSFQRPFIEYYKLYLTSELWKTQKDADFEIAKCDIIPPMKLLSRNVPYSKFNCISPKTFVSHGTFTQNIEVEKLWKGREFVNISPRFKGYRENELEVIPSIEIQKTKSISNEKVLEKYDAKPLDCKVDQFAIVDFATNLTGFVGMKIHCSQKTRLYLTFDEILQDNDVNFKRLACVNAIGYELQPGNYHLESFEPYTLRYLKLMAIEGDIEVSNIYLREMANDHTDLAEFDCSDPDLVEIFEAAKQTFRQNATDVFMDCPSRERAGWLCDSFFTARVALDLTGDTTIEKNMFENYLLPDKFDHIPAGMLPMCYPADHNDGVFIPNWALWFVVQLDEYLVRSNDRELVDALESRVMELLKYFEGFENNSGLLENLEGWIFIEWSRANAFVRPINYPTNMLYSHVLEVVSRIYDKPQLLEKSKKLKKTILSQSFDGQFFVDNAVRKDGIAKSTANKSEVCQYYAFYFNIASPQTHPHLWNKLCNDFGPDRKDTKAYPQVHMANAFVGNYLRLELLSRYNESLRLKNELAGYFLYMAQQTGTLWENVSTSASCNHGFASHVAHCLYRDVLGVEIDPVKKTVNITLRDLGLENCSGQIPTAHGVVSVKWDVNNNQIHLDVSMPRDYKLIKKNFTGKLLDEKITILD
ncbi:MAG: hypothetical protein JEZ07_04020 [Phycisphaerae bacterium]|nr:hypothetical protein [Phycisphaerae bacterium]